MSTEADPGRPPLPPAVPPRPGLPPRVPGDPSGGSGERLPAAAARRAGAAACLVLGLGLLGGAAAGTWLAGEPPQRSAPAADFAAARTLWRELPVDTLFPPVLEGEGAGPGGADRRWTRIAVAPDGGCAGAFDPLLAEALAPVGCARLVRATYTDETASNVTTVGMVFTEADRAAMRRLHGRFAAEGLDRRAGLMPRPYAAPGTAAAGFGDAQRASWSLLVLTDLPVVVYAVSGFADGRTVDEPQPAAEAAAEGPTTAPAQAGLGHAAQGIAEHVERGLRRAATGRAAEETGNR